MRRDSEEASPPPGLTGSLEAFSPLEVIQWMAFRTGEGVLTIESTESGARRRVRIHCRDGIAVSLRVEGFDGSANDPTPAGESPGRLGALLVERGSLQAAELRYALAYQSLSPAGEKPPLGEVLRKHRFVSERELAEGFKMLAVRRLAEAAAWRRGSFAFHPGALKPPYLPLGERLERLLLRSARSLDESAAEAT